MKARIRDTEIYFDVTGFGLVADGATLRERPTAFLIHGGPGGDHAASKSGFESLAGRMQLVFFDHRGQGRSARHDPEKYTLDENVEDMEALRLHLGLGSIVSIGTSYGGMVAMAHAARYPQSVSHLILVVTASHAGYAQRAIEITAERGSAEQIEMCKALFAGQIDTPEKLRNYYDVMGSLYSRRHDPVLFRAAIAKTILEPPALNRAHGPGGFLRSFDLRPQLAAIIAPTLILAGRHDWICAPEFSEEIHRLIAGSDLRIFEDSAHFLSGDESQKFLDAIAGFLVYQRG